MAKVRFYVDFRGFTDEKDIEIKAVNDLGELIRTLVDRYGEEFEERIYGSADKRSQTNIPIVVNGIRPHLLKGLKTPGMKI